MADGQRFNFLKDLVKPRKATPETLGSGLAQRAGTALVGRKQYQDYVVSTQETGEEPMSYEEFKKKNS